jgi:hypothetical protein
MHFRHQDDEIMFGRLKAYLIQSMQGAPDHVLNNALRVLGRIESMAFYEGVRQGSVARAIEDKINPELDRRPIAQHARLYNGAFTPLVEAEKAYVSRFLVNQDFDEAWMDDWIQAEPMLIPPMTLSEALARPEQAFGLAAMQQGSRSVAEEKAPAPAHDGAFAGMDVLASLLADENQQLADIMRQATANGLMDFSVAETDGSSFAAEQPGFIEQCRDSLQGRMSGGWRPDAWKDVVFAVRDDLKADPYMIDLSLSTDVGKNMLRSIGLFEIADSILDASQIQAMLHSGL